MAPGKKLHKLEDLPLEGRRVFMRVDLDCPIGPRKILQDESKIQAIVPSIRAAVDAGARLVLASHLGSPDGKRVPSLSMTIIGERLAAILDRDIYVPDDAVGDGPRKVIMERLDGEIVLLQNLGFYSDEQANDDLFAQRLGALADVYVNEAFALNHLSLASTATLPKYLTVNGAGPLFHKEFKRLNALKTSLDSNLVLIAGGETVGGTFDLIQAFFNRIKTLVIGGPMVATWLAANGMRVGLSPVEADKVEAVTSLLGRARLRGFDVILPKDVAIIRQADPDKKMLVGPVNQIPDDGIIVDLGPATIREINASFAEASTVLWAGELGRGLDQLDATEAVGKALSKCRASGTIVGDNLAAAMKMLMLTPFLGHVSTGGDASIRFLEGVSLPGLKSFVED